MIQRRPKIGVITAQFNSEITSQLEAGALLALKEHGLTNDEIVVARVPGAVEIPLIAQTLIHAGCEGVVALGCVIRGETTHYDSVCRMVEAGCNTVMLQTGRPIGFGVITTENEDQALARAGGAHGNKGSEAAHVTMQMVSLVNRLKTPTHRRE
jgi:6,7-dimethyl-8-ribityllumazine synthase